MKNFRLRKQQSSALFNYSTKPDMGNNMETARELATHAADIKHLQEDMDKLVSDMNEIKATLVNIQTTLAEAKGGWRVLLLMGSAAGLVGAGIMHVFNMLPNWHK